MSEPRPTRITEVCKPPEFFCIDHGRKMAMRKRLEYDVRTGKRVVSALVFECPRWFCMQSILMGVTLGNPIRDQIE